MTIGPRLQERPISKLEFLALSSLFFRSGLDSAVFPGVGWLICLDGARKAWLAGYGAAVISMVKRTSSDLD